MHKTLDAPPPIDIGRVLRWIWSRRRQVFLGLLVGAVLGFAAGVVRPREHVATSVFAPVSPATPGSRLGGLAGQLGITLPLSSGSAEESLEFYSHVLQSFSLRKELLKSPVREGSNSMTLLAVMRGSHASTEDTLAAVKSLENNIDGSIDTRAGVITLRTMAGSAGVAESMNSNILHLLNVFVADRRTAHSRQERVFLEQRMEQARAELADAEVRIQRFLERNRRSEEHTSE